MSNFLYVFSITIEMALHVIESIILTFGICASVHLLVSLLQSLEDGDRYDCSMLMQRIAKEKFWNTFSVHQHTFIQQLPYYH